MLLVPLLVPPLPHPPFDFSEWMVPALAYADYTYTLKSLMLKMQQQVVMLLLLVVVLLLLLLLPLPLL